MAFVWSTKTKEEVLKSLGANVETGLSDADALKRLGMPLKKQNSFLSKLFHFSNKRSLWREKKAIVVRGGSLKIVVATELVRGDLVIIRAGDLVPADLRIVFGELIVDEKALGENAGPVKKEDVAVSPGATVSSQRNLVFAGSLVVSGEARGVVVEPVGTTYLESIKKDKSFERDEVGRGVLLVNRKAASDLKDASVVVLGKRSLVSPEFKISEMLSLDSILKGSVDMGDSREILMDAQLASDSMEVLDNNSVKVVGRSIERSVGMAALEAGLSLKRLEQKGFYFLDRYVFDGKKVASLYDTPGWPNKFYISGRPEDLVAAADFVWRKSEKVPISSLWKEEIKRIIDKKSADGFNVVAVSVRDVGWKTIPKDTDLLSGTTFIGLIVLKSDPLDSVKKFVSTIKNSGKLVVLASGEHPEAIYKLALITGIVESEGQIIYGSDIKSFSDKELYAALKRKSVFGRLSKEDKLRIAQVLHDYGEKVAWFAEERSDVLALLSSDVGIVSGLAEDVVKESADLILEDGLRGLKRLWDKK